MWNVGVGENLLRDEEFSGELKFKKNAFVKDKKNLDD